MVSKGVDGTTPATLPLENLQFCTDGPRFSANGRQYRWATSTGGEKTQAPSPLEVVSPDGNRKVYVDRW
ncbi:MAG: hypothetical protein JRH15_23650 [Deltaproteobacteria bacterium]|nr:hypothetical protein [Deltaproteobacteria bacterium]